VTYTKYSPNHSGLRTHAIDRITPHCVVGQLSVESLGGIFANEERWASSNYGIGADGRVALYVDEANRSWCSSDARNDQRAVTIECASDTEDPYAMNTAVWDALVRLCADICARNGKNRLIWIPDREIALNYDLEPDEMLLTVHRWFAAKSCPGDWLFNRLGELANAVTKILNPSGTGVPGDGDTPHEWAADAVEWAVSRGILRGRGNTLALNDPVTREEMCVMLYRAREVL
jgi:hypothetical protein